MPVTLQADAIESVHQKLRRSLKAVRREWRALRNSDRRFQESWTQERVRIEGAEPLVRACWQGKPVLVVLPFTSSALASLFFLAVRLERTLVIPHYPGIEPILAPWCGGGARLEGPPGTGLRIVLTPLRLSRCVEALRAHPRELLVTFPDLWHRSWPAALGTFLNQPIRCSLLEELLRLRVPSLSLFTVSGRRGLDLHRHELRVGPALAPGNLQGPDPPKLAVTTADLVQFLDAAARARPHELLSWTSLHGCLRTSEQGRLRIELGMIRACLALLREPDREGSDRLRRLRSLAGNAIRTLQAAREGRTDAIEAFRKYAAEWGDLPGGAPGDRDAAVP